MDIEKTQEEKIVKAVLSAAQRSSDTAVLEDLFAAIRNLGKTDTQAALGYLADLRRYIRSDMSAAAERKDFQRMESLYDLNRKALYFESPHSFDAFLRAMEYDAPENKKFYKYRRIYLKPMVDGYQDILDGKLHMLTISMPKRAGKSTTELLFTLLLSGLHPEKASLMEGTGDALVNSFYKGMLEYLVPGNPYHFYDIFPNAPLVQTNADMKTINLQDRSRFPTVMCRSIDSRQVGLSEATNLLVLDDCVEGREEAKNRARLDEKWEVISGDILGRAIEGTPIVVTGTRYSLYDPIGRFQELAHREGWTWRAIEIPALDPITDESNYEFETWEGKKQFTSAFFREQRNILTAEQWESEFQQQPFEAKGLLFPTTELNYYTELPVGADPDTIIAVCDTAESGADSTALVVARIYGPDIFISDVVFDDSPATVTKPECARALISNSVANVLFESNNAGSYFARDVEEICRQRGYSIAVRTKRTISNKQTRIEFAADNIRKHFFFKDPSTYERGSQYWAFMKEVTTYVRTGKVPHDDAPDALSLLENEVRTISGSRVEVFSRPF